MKESEFKLFPDFVMRKLMLLKEEGISQDIEIFPVLLFIGINDETHLAYERILRILRDAAYPFNGEILDVYPDYVVLSFDIFRTLRDDVFRALAFASQLKSFDFVKYVFITQRRGIFRYINIKGREFVFIDSGAFSEYSGLKNSFDSGIFIDENIYYELYHNVKVEPVGEQVLKVLSVRECFIPYMRPDFIGKNPLQAVTQEKVITVRGERGSGKTKVSLHYLREGGFERIVHVKLISHMKYIPFSAVSQLARCLEFYRKNKGNSPCDFVKEMLSEPVKTAIFFENGEFIDSDSRQFIKSLVGQIPPQAVFIFEGGERWEDEVPIMLEGYTESKGIEILKSIAGGRKPDRTVIEILNSLDDVDYQMIYDFYTIFSFKKFFIFGEDVFYVHPAARSRGGVFLKDKLYELLFESLDEGEQRELLKIILSGSSVNLDRVRLGSLIRLLRHGILRIDGNCVTVCSQEVARRFLNWVDRDKILAYLENEVEEDTRIIRAEILSFIGKRRAAFRELKQYLDSVDSGRKTLKYILYKLLELEPTDRERIEILRRLYEVDKVSGSYDTALSHLKEALRTAKSTKDKRAIAEVLYELGKFNLEIGQSGAAIMNFKDALRFAKESGDEKAYVSILLDIAEFYLKKNDMERIVEVLRELETIEIKDKYHMARYLYYYGLYHLYTENINRAHSILEDAYNVARKTRSEILISNILAALAKTELLFKQYRVAEQYANEALLRDSKNIEARLVLSRIKFVEHAPDEAMEILYEISTSGSADRDVLLDLAALLAYKGRYKQAIGYLDELLEKEDIRFKNKVLKRKVRYLLRLGQYADAYGILSGIKDEELNDEFNIFLMADKYTPISDTPYLRAVISFATLASVENLNFSFINDYDYIDAGWMVEFNKAVNELVSGSYEAAYERMKAIDNMYFRASLAVNIAKYIIDRGGDGNMFLREAGDIAEKEEYLEVLMWIYMILGKKDKARELFERMFKDEVELKDNYIQARKYVFNRI